MAHFIGGVQGSRGSVTRLGSKDSGIHGFVYGWNVGVQFNIYVDRDGEDVIRIVANGGSNGRQRSLPVGEVKIVDGVLTFTPDKED